MENMRPVFVYLNAADILCINVSGNMMPPELNPVNHKALLPCLLHLICKHSAKKPCAHHQIIIFHMLFTPP